MKIVFFILLCLTALVFRNWFVAGEIIGGDWPYFYEELLYEFSFFPPSWAQYQGNGLGGEFVSYSLDTYLYVVVFLFVKTFGFSWEIIQKIFFFGLFIVVGFFSSQYFLSVVLPHIAKVKLLSALCSVLFISNTYILMTVGGGQMGIALAYSFTPLVLARFVLLFNDTRKEIYNAVVSAIFLGITILFDIRIAYIVLIAVGLYLLFRIPIVHFRKNMRGNIIIMVSFSISLVIALLLNSFWLLPILLSGSNIAYEVVISRNSESVFQFLSFAPFSQTISLLHPNWPENIFGKVYFTKPEFLLLPIISFSSLFFINREKEYKKTILYLLLLALIGAFLAKGANPPFGEVNIWLYNTVPGFILFRDPTKFYLLTVLSYMILIPFSLFYIHKAFTIFKLKKNRNGVSFIFTAGIVFYLVFLSWPAFSGQLSGTFRSQKVPTEYKQLKNFLHSQPEFFRILWVPRQHRFSYYSNLHPSVEAMGLFAATNSAELTKNLHAKDLQKKLENISVKYVIVPYDVLGEIFIKDRKYDNKKYLEAVKEINSLEWLSHKRNFGKIVVYEVPNPKGHFYTLTHNHMPTFQESPSSFRVEVSQNDSGNLTFSESFNPHWKVKNNDKIFSSKKGRYSLNTFELGKIGKGKVTVYFDKEKYYSIGRIVSALAFSICIAFAIIAKRNSYEKKVD